MINGDTADCTMPSKKVIGGRRTMMTGEIIVEKNEEDDHQFTYPAKTFDPQAQQFHSPIPNRANGDNDGQINMKKL